MVAERLGDIAAGGHDPEAVLLRIRDQRFDQLLRDTAPPQLRWCEGVVGDAHILPLRFAVAIPGQLGFRFAVGGAGDVATTQGLALALIFAADGDGLIGHGEVSLKGGSLSLALNARGSTGVPMLFLSDNAASVHPKVWEAMRAADGPDSPYDGDGHSQALDEKFAATFGRDCTALWVATGTAANCLALATMCQPHGGVVCHEEAHIEADEGGAPGFFLHGAKLLLVPGESAKLTPEAVRAAIDPIRDDVHQVQPHALSITQASEYGVSYRPDEVAALIALAKAVSYTHLTMPTIYSV